MRLGLLFPVLVMFQATSAFALDAQVTVASGGASCLESALATSATADSQMLASCAAVPPSNASSCVPQSSQRDLACEQAVLANNDLELDVQDFCLVRTYSCTFN